MTAAPAEALVDSTAIPKSSSEPLVAVGSTGEIAAAVLSITPKSTDVSAKFAIQSAGSVGIVSMERPNRRGGK